MYTLYGSRGSGSSVVEMALEVADAPFFIVHASAWEPDSAIAELEKINPLRQIPTLVLPDGSVMTESAAILIHLGLEYPKSGLLPTDSSRRAQCMRGLVFIAANCYSALGVADHPERWCTDADETTLERVVSAARAQLHRNWEIFADVFPAGPWFTGDAPGALDFHAAVVSKWSGTRAHLRAARPDFLATIELIEQHPSVADTFMRHWPA